MRALVLVPLALALVVSGCASREVDSRAAYGLPPAQYDPRPYVMVLGAVPQPGRYLMVAPVTATQLVAAAGGITVTGYRAGVTLTRTSFEGRRIRVRIDLERVLEGRGPDVPLYPGDVLFVPERTF